MEKTKSILTRIRLITMIPFAVFLIILIWQEFSIYKNEKDERTLDRLAYEDSILADALNIQIETVENACNSIIIYLNDHLKGAVVNREGVPSVDSDSARLLYDCVNGPISTYRSSLQVELLFPNGINFVKSWSNYSMTEEDRELYLELEDTGIDQHGRWMTDTPQNLSIGKENPCYVKAYIDIESGKQRGYLLIESSRILEVVTNRSAELKEVFIFDGEHQAIYSSGRGLSYEDVQKFDLDSDVYVNSITLRNGWILTVAADLKEEREGTNKMLFFILFMVISVMLIIYFLIEISIRRLLRPIKDLSDYMAESRNKLPEPIAIRTENDEARILVHSFNEMAERNNGLINELFDEKRKSERLRFSLLQSQIKPHFLYNTLDTIFCLSEMGMNKQASEMTKLLSSYYRHVLSSGSDMVLLSEELDHTEDYLKMQSIRYSDLVDYSIHRDEEVPDVKIPKLTLQPLVENAIYHGIRPSGHKGTLTVTVSHDAQWVIIRVSDDGIGFEEGVFERKMSEEETDEEGFGIRSVYTRLQLYYGDAVEMEMRRENVTIVELKIPYIREE